MNTKQQALVRKFSALYPELSHQELATKFDVEVVEIRRAIDGHDRMEHIKKALVQSDQLKEAFENSQTRYTSERGEALLDLCVKLLQDVAAAVLEQDGRINALTMAIGTKAKQQEEEEDE